ncbi:squalene synthase HpnC [Wenxinia marina]|nr:squalene synthase HpnC [Wenxinia marina]
MREATPEMAYSSSPPAPADPLAVNLPRAPGRENFPVASVLIASHLRPAIRAFYDVVRHADDIADDPHLPSAEKARRIDRIAAGLNGDRTGDGRTIHLLEVLDATGHRPAARHALRMMDAFRADIRSEPCRDWSDLAEYCRASADPVGRFLLDLHDEGSGAHEASDALCTALQILNHLQDMGEDRRALGRVYLPLAMIAEAGGRVEDLDRPALTPGLRGAVDRALARTGDLLDRAAELPSLLRSRRLAAEARTILSLARSLSRRLRDSDPLAHRVAPTRPDAARAVAAGVLSLAGVGRGRTAT